MSGKPTKQKSGDWQGSLYFFNYDQLEKTLVDLPVEPGILSGF